MKNKRSVEDKDNTKKNKTKKILLKKLDPQLNVGVNCSLIMQSIVMTKG